MKGEPDGIASFHRLIPGLCNAGGAYPPVVHSDTFVTSGAFSLGVTLPNFSRLATC